MRRMGEVRGPDEGWDHVRRQASAAVSVKRRLSDASPVVADGPGAATAGTARTLAPGGGR